MRRSLIGLAAAGAVFVLVLGAWIIDLRAYEGRVVRDVRVAGRSVGGLGPSELRALVDGLAREAERGRVEIRTSRGAAFSVAAADLGLKVDVEGTVRAAMRVGRTGTVVSRFGRWARSAFGATAAPVRVGVDHDAVYAVVEAKDPGPRVPATEPSVRADDGELEVIPGKDGRGIDAAEVIRELPKALRSGLPARLQVTRGRVSPRHDEEDAERLLERAEQLTARPLRVTAGDADAVVGVRTLRSWLTTDGSGGELELAVDGPKVLKTLGRVLADAGRKPTDARFAVSAGQVQIRAGRQGTGCCAERAAALVQQAIIEAKRDPLRLPLKPVEPKFSVADARALGITELIGSFTTRHPAGEPRVHNIHRIADLLQGTVIRPGAVLSLNDKVGRRTTARGFVNAPVIEEGKLSEGIGGGVSQYATTIFNAAFMGGLDFVEYQSHSLYISRYPYGREATLSYPKPDLKLRNPSKYGVLVWASYDGTTITVNLYSTRFADSTQTGQTKSPRGECTLVRTSRSRRFLADDTVKVDHVNALYRPKEGVNCG